jgi:DNA polymerase-3 subunit gamma/tau
MNELIGQGKDVRQILTELSEYLRALLLYQAAPHYGEIYLTDTKEALKQLAPLFTEARIVAAQQRLHEAMEELRWAVRGKITAEFCIFDLCKLEERLCRLCRQEWKNWKRCLSAKIQRKRLPW